MLGKDRLHLNIIVAGITQHFYNFPEWVFGMLRPVSDLTYHFLSAARTFQGIKWDKYINRHIAAVGNQKGKLFRYVYDTHELISGPFHDLNDPAFGLFVFPFWEELYLNNIFMQGVIGVVRSDENVITVIFRDHIGLTGF